MTPEKLKEIEAKAQELYPIPKRDYLSSTNAIDSAIAVCSQEAYTAGALSRQPELDTLQSENTRLRERVRELEEGLRRLILKAERCYDATEWPADGSSDIEKETESAKRLLTKPDSTGGGEKEVCKHALTYVDDDNFWKCQKCNEIVD